ncbi:hypothetical protein EV138_0836 [Kribbella voronezhensis]|uniref:Uncharacterized protein n=1 Tax=Kribbella voronezhensis TaxID=2512212 RepID=A0A4R7T6I0_9ACTN|nr:hypothetical protein [Kribbella voronezhensis]TDU87315.1 hypothetical protein EV138_0836 [Kribbella voronezhensis]
MTEHPVPRWADRLAHVIPFLVLPSSLWRLGLVAGSSMGVLDDAGRRAYLHGFGEHFYVVCLSLFSEAVALTAFGMVRRWGEVVPRWIPWLGGRRVAPYAAIIPATLGSLALIAIWSFAFRDGFTGDFLAFSSTAAEILMVACYAPLNLWGPALLVLTWAYWRRRRLERQPHAVLASS